MNTPTMSCTGDTILGEVVIDAPRTTVWASLTNARLLTSWWGSPDTYRVDYWNLDVRPGGKWDSGGTSVDGSKFSVSGEFVEVSPVERLAMTWNPSWDSIPQTVIRYVLSEEGKSTRLRLTHGSFEGHVQSRDGHAAGWARILEWLGAFAEQHAKREVGT